MTGHPPTLQPHVTTDPRFARNDNTASFRVGDTSGHTEPSAPAPALAAAKRALTDGADMPLAAALDLERRLAASLSQ